MRSREIKKGLKSKIPADLQQWNTAMAVAVLMGSGTDSRLMLSLLGCRWFQRAVGTELK